MTRYAPQVPSGRYVYGDWRNTLILSGYDYTPATASPGESYRPVTLEWSVPDEPSGVLTFGVAANGWRGNRVYRITHMAAEPYFGVTVNGLHLPVQFGDRDSARLFCQCIEDLNTED